MTRWAGVDVGGRRKGFHAAAIDERGVVAGPTQLASPADAVAWLAERAPALVAVDSPQDAAPAGRRSRDDERLLARAVCGIRYTPERALLGTSAYYEWIVHGLELYAALAAGGLDAVECFPTASWTRWAGARAGRRRSDWSTAALAQHRLSGVPARLSQDGRDALGAALTARAHAHGETERFGAIVVPLGVTRAGATAATARRRSRRRSRPTAAAAPAGR